MLKSKLLWIGASVILGTTAIMGIGYRAGKEAKKIPKKSNGSVKKEERSIDYYNQNSSAEDKVNKTKPKNSVVADGFGYLDENGGKLGHNYFLQGLALVNFPDEGVDISFKDRTSIKNPQVPKYKTAMSGNIIYVRIYDCRDFDIDRGEPTYILPNQISGKKLIKSAKIIDSRSPEQILVKITLRAKYRYRTFPSPKPTRIRVSVRK